MVKNDIQQYTNKVLFYRFYNHVDVFVFEWSFHPPDHFFIDRVFQFLAAIGYVTLNNSLQELKLLSVNLRIFD